MDKEQVAAPEIIKDKDMAVGQPHRRIANGRERQ